MSIFINRSRGFAYRHTVLKICLYLPKVMVKVKDKIIMRRKPTLLRGLQLRRPVG